MQSSDAMYVYQYTDEEGQVVYVGKGRNHRCLDRHKRSSELVKFMDRSFSDRGLDFVFIHTRNLSPEDAHSLEQRLIKDLKPLYNRMGVSAANAGRAQNNHNSRFSAERVEHLRGLWESWDGSMRSFHRDKVPDVAWSTLRKLLTGESYATFP